jgi:hypothetical protein
MEYRAPRPITREAAEEAFASGDRWRVCEALVDVAFFDPNWQWVESVCVRLSDASAVEVRAIALTCLGHLARIHRQLDLDLAAPVIRRGLADAQLAGQAQDALDDLIVFLGTDALRPYGLA